MFDCYIVYFVVIYFTDGDVIYSTLDKVGVVLDEFGTANETVDTLLDQLGKGGFGDDLVCNLV